MKIAILGAGGMLGHVLNKAMAACVNHEVTPLYRDNFDAEPTTQLMVGTKLSKLLGYDTDYLINCIGAIKPTFSSTKQIVNPIYVNAVLPHQMSFWGASTGTRVIHISTDCVFDGKEGPYDETRQHNALDEYGKSKSLGEPSDCMVLRTSIIGPEVPGKKKSLFEWVRAQKNGTVPGFINHFWNGLTTLELSNAIIKIIEYNYYSNGVFHLHSEDVTKANLVKSISDAFGFNVTIIPTEAPSICDRRLRSVKPLNSRIAPASLSKMLEELKSGK